MFRGPILENLSVAADLYKEKGKFWMFSRCLVLTCLRGTI